jgi:hypothetical protein
MVLGKQEERRSAITGRFRASVNAASAIAQDVERNHPAHAHIAQVHDSF